MSESCRLTERDVTLRCDAMRCDALLACAQVPHLTILGNLVIKELSLTLLEKSGSGIELIGRSIEVGVAWPENSPAQEKLIDVCVGYIGVREFSGRTGKSHFLLQPKEGLPTKDPFTGMPTPSTSTVSLALAHALAHSSSITSVPNLLLLLRSHPAASQDLASDRDTVARRAAAALLHEGPRALAATAAQVRSRASGGAQPARGRAATREHLEPCVVRRVHHAVHRAAHQARAHQAAR